MAKFIKPILNIYLAGRIDGISKNEAAEWRAEAMLKLSKKGLIGICPVVHGKELGESDEVQSLTHYQDIFKIDLDLIYRSEAVIVNLDKNSFGTAQELFYATVCLNIPVIAFNNIATNSAFMHSTVYESVPTIDDAIEVILNINKKMTYDEHEALAAIHELVLNKEHFYQVPRKRLEPRV